MIFSLHANCVHYIWILVQSIWISTLGGFLCEIKSEVRLKGSVLAQEWFGNREFLTIWRSILSLFVVLRFPAGLQRIRKQWRIQTFQHQNPKNLRFSDLTVIFSEEKSPFWATSIWINSDFHRRRWGRKVAQVINKNVKKDRKLEKEWVPDNSGFRIGFSGNQSDHTLEIGFFSQ